MWQLSLSIQLIRLKASTYGHLSHGNGCHRQRVNECRHGTERSMIDHGTPWKKNYAGIAQKKALTKAPWTAMEFFSLHGSPWNSAYLSIEQLRKPGPPCSQQPSTQLWTGFKRLPPRCHGRVHNSGPQFLDLGCNGHQQQRRQRRKNPKSIQLRKIASYILQRSNGGKLFFVPASNPFFLRWFFVTSSENC